MVDTVLYFEVIAATNIASCCVKKKTVPAPTLKRCFFERSDGGLSKSHPPALLGSSDRPTSRHAIFDGREAPANADEVQAMVSPSPLNPRRTTVGWIQPPRPVLASWSPSRRHHCAMMLLNVAGGLKAAKPLQIWPCRSTSLLTHGTHPHGTPVFGAVACLANSTVGQTEARLKEAQNWAWGRPSLLRRQTHSFKLE